MISRITISIVVDRRGKSEDRAKVKEKIDERETVAAVDKNLSYRSKIKKINNDNSNNNNNNNNYERMAARLWRETLCQMRFLVADR